MRATGERGASRGIVAVVIAALLGGLGLAPLTLAASPAQAAIPTPSANEAVLQMSIADERIEGTTVAPLPNAIFGLFAAPPDAYINADDGFVHVTELPAGSVLFQCKSDADGDCVFTVPIRPGDTTACEQTPTDPRSGAWPATCQAGAGVQQGTQLWAAAIAYNPDTDGFDYYANPWWQTAPLANNNHISIRHIFPTPELVGGRTYRAGTDWITPAGTYTADPRTPSDPSLPTNPSRQQREDFARRTASGGITPLSRFNIDFPQQCGMNVGMIVDVSSSIGNSNAQGQLVDVMDSFVDALRGTPSQVALLSFGTDSPANGFGANTGLQSVATTGDADAVKAQYASWRTRSWPTNYTNWDRGLAAAAAMNAPTGDPHHLDLVLFITDGNPTVYGANPLEGGSPRDNQSGYTRFRELGNGLLSANLVKSQGTRILAFGVGSGMDDPNTAYNLRTISGRNQYTPTPSGPYETSNLLDADWVQTTDWTTAAAAMRSLVLEACAPSISVVKRIVPNGGTVADATLPTTQWGFEATTSSPDVSLTPQTPPYALTDLGSGGVSFDIDFADTTQAPAAIRVEEDAAAQPDYTPMPDETRCVERSTGADVPLTVTSDGTTAFSVDVDLEQMVTCVVYNMAPPDVVPASVMVNKQWRVVTATGVAVYPDGRQPAGLAAQLSLTGPDSSDATAQPWSTVRNGYDSASPNANRNSTTINETLNISADLPLCRASGPPEIKPGAPDSSSDYETLPSAGLDSGPLPAGVSEWTIQNTIECDSRLTLVKDVTNGPLATDEGDALWDLTGYGPDGTPGIPAQITGHSGDASVTDVPVVPDAVYQLAETIPDPAPPGEDGHYMYHYRQADVRATPTIYPLSSGSWDCRPTGNPTGNPSLGAEGAVVVPLGQAYTCIAVNSTALLTVDKTVDGVPAANPDDWQFLVTANDPILIPDPQTHQFPASVEQSLVPGQSYNLTEVAGLSNYELESMTCTTGGEPIPDLSDFALLVGASATCTANNVTIPPGTFTLTKALEGTAADDPALDGTEFAVDWSANTTPIQSGTITLTPGQTAGPGLDLPEGTVVTLSEATPTMPTSPPITWAGATWSGTGITPLPDGTAQLTIGRSSTVAATVTNTVLAPGQFTVQKLVSGNAADDPALDDATFTFSYTVDGNPGANSPFTLAPGAIFTSEELADGAQVVVTETATDVPPGYTQDGLTWAGGTPQGDDAVTFQIPTDASVAATATNAISQPAWFQITKTLTGTAAADPAFTSNPPDCTSGVPFTIDWAATAGPSAGQSGTVTLHSGTAPCNTSAPIGLLPGTEVRLSEHDPSGDADWPAQVTWSGVDWTPGATFTLGASGTTVDAGAENTVTAPGSFQIVKTITGAAGNPLIAGLCFAIDWTSSSGDSGSVVITADNPSPEVTLPAGSEVTLHENGITTSAPGCSTSLPDNFTWEGVTWSGPGVTTSGGDAHVTISSATTAAVAAANQITAPGSFTLEKLLDGTGADMIRDAGATFDVNYTVDGGSPTTVTLTPGTVEGPIELPNGAHVALAETPGSLPDGVAQGTVAWTINGTPADPAAFTVQSDTEVAATVTNTVVAPGFQVRKQITGDAADEADDTEFTVNWSADTSPAQSGTLAITGAGLSEGVNLPAGTTLTLTEATPTDLPDEVTWESHRFVAAPGVAVSADGHTATVTIPAATAEQPLIEVNVVNEFTGTPPTPTPTPTPPTPTPTPPSPDPTTPPSPEPTTPGSLPNTGSSIPLVPLVSLAGASLLLGIGLLVSGLVGRRRRAAGSRGE